MITFSSLMKLLIPPINRAPSACNALASAEAFARSMAKLRDRVREIERDCEPGAVCTATANLTRFRREAVFSGRYHCGTS